MRGAQLIIIVFVILLLFGGKKIPELMKGLGKGVHAFKEGIEEAKAEMNKPLESEKKPEDKGKDQD
jgi:sec-independent protein translocase protein TatA